MLWIKFIKTMSVMTMVMNISVSTINTIMPKLVTHLLEKRIDLYDLCKNHINLY